MTTVKIKLSFDIVSKENKTKIFTKQWDNLTRRLLISLEQNRKAFEAPANAMVFLRGKKIDGNVFYITGTATENIGEYEFLLSKNSLSSSGIIRCDVAYSYLDGDETPVCSTNEFIIDNLSAACSPDEYEAENEYKSIEEFLARANDVLGKLDGVVGDTPKSDAEIYVKRRGMGVLEIPDITPDDNRVQLQVTQTETAKGATIGVPSNNVYNFANSFSGYMKDIQYKWDGKCGLTFVGNTNGAGDVIIYEGGAYPFSEENIIFAVCGNAVGMTVEISAAGGYSAVVNPNESIKIPKGAIKLGSEWGITVKSTDARVFNGEKLYLMFNYGTYPTVVYNTDEEGKLLFPCKPNAILVCPDREMTAIYQCDIIDFVQSPVAVDIPKIESNEKKITIEPNKLYIFPEMASLNIKLGGIIDNTIVQEYKFRFISAATPTVLTLPETVKGDISVNANSIVEISIIDNYAVSQSWAV